jgi:WD40 repeat protein
MSQTMPFELVELDMTQFDITKDLLSGSYNKQIIEEYICLICHSISMKPKECSKCNAIFCTKCIDRSLLSKNTCPGCQKVFTGKPVSGKLLNILNLTQIKCPNDKCQEDSIKLEFITQHLKTCMATKRLAKCKGCKKEIATTNELSEVNQHIEECLEFTVECPNCERAMKKKVFVNHSKICVYRLVQCEDCLLQMRENELVNHGRKECVNALRDYYENKIAEMMMVYEPDRMRKKRTQNNSTSSVIKNLTPNIKPKSNLIELPLEYPESDNEHEVIADMDCEKVIELNDFVNCFIKMEWKMNNNTIITGGYKLIVWNCDDNQPIKRIDCPQGHICQALIQLKLYQCDYLVISSGDKGVYVFDILSGELNAVISHETHKIHSLLQLDAFQTASRIITGSTLKYLSVYKLTTSVIGTKINEQGSGLDNKEPIHCLEHIDWKRDQNTVAVGGASNVSLWDIHNRIKIRIIEVGSVTYSLLHMKWNIDDVTLLTGCRGNISAWNVMTTERLDLFRLHKGTVNCMMQMNWIIDDFTIVSGAEDRTIKLIDVIRGNVIALNEHSHEVKSLLQINNTLYSLDSRYLKQWNIKIRKVIDSTNNSLTS